MLRIGKFSRLSQVPVRTLRYYDEIGLLKPAQADRFTGYRYYSVDQLPRLNRILTLKDMGLSLDQIAQLLEDELSPAEIRGMLRLKRAQIQQHIEEEQGRLARVEAQLRQIEEGWLEARNEEEGASMDIGTCPECGKEVREPAVRYCPHCGASLTISPAPLLPVRKSAGQLAKRSVGLLLLGIVLITALSGLVLVVRSRRGATIPSLMSGPLSEVQPPDPKLTLLATQCERPTRGGQFVFEGKVHNISGSSLQDVIAVVSMYDASPSLIRSAEASIEHTTLLPGQTSSFRVAVDYDPTIAYYKVKFKHRQGDTIPTQSNSLG
jgi:DNA-binding transcriptional MerR regulator